MIRINGNLEKIHPVKRHTLRSYMKGYFKDYLETFEDKESYLQMLYDGGCALVDMKIINKNEQGKYILNAEFFDYESWKFAKKRVKDNCQFLKELGHPLFG